MMPGGPLCAEFVDDGNTLRCARCGNYRVPHKMAPMDDRRHLPLCDWNLYPEYRDDPETCNLDCLAHQEEVAEQWARHPNWPAQFDGSGAAPDGADACPLHGDDPPCIPCLASEHIDGPGAHNAPYKPTVPDPGQKQL